MSKNTTLLCRSHTAPLLFTLLLCAPGCAPSDGGQVGEETVVCKPIVTESIAATDTTPLNFTVVDILDLAEGSHSAPIRWANNATGTLNATLTFTGNATFQERAWVDENDSGADIEPALEALGCPDILELEMMVQLETSDGELNESWTVLLQAPASSEAGFYQNLDTLTGDLDITSFAPVGEFDAHHAGLDFRIDASGISGSISGQAEASDPDSGTASATSYPIADFGIPSS